jgi:hypothetical protein
MEFFHQFSETSRGIPADFCFTAVIVEERSVNEAIFPIEQHQLIAADAVDPVANVDQ